MVLWKAFIKLELLASPSYTKITQLKAFCLWRHGTRKFPASTAVPVLAYLSSHCIKVPNVACDAEDIYAMHSNFKTIFRNVEQNLRSGRLHHWATQMAQNHEFTVRVIHSSQGNSNPFRGIIQPFRGIIQPFRDISRDELWIVKLAHEEGSFY